jgi:hypothetical protein
MENTFSLVIGSFCDFHLDCVFLGLHCGELDVRLACYNIKIKQRYAEPDLGCALICQTKFTALVCCRGRLRSNCLVIWSISEILIDVDSWRRFQRMMACPQKVFDFPDLLSLRLEIKVLDNRSYKFIADRFLLLEYVLVDYLLVLKRTAHNLTLPVFRFVCLTFHI